MDDRALPEDRLAHMIGEMKNARVEELDHRDYHALLRTMEILVTGLGAMAKRGPCTSTARRALVEAAQRAAKDSLPVNP